jgi:chromosome segregation ATPase
VIVGTLGNSLRQHLRKLACKTPVDQLVKQGVKEVKVVGLDHIVALIEEAVHRTLRSKLMGLERDQLAGATREEFLRLLQSHQTLQRTHDEVLRRKTEAEEEIDQLRRQLAAHNAELREKLATAERELRAQYEGENNEIIEKINGVFLELSTKPDVAVTELRNRVVELVMDVVGRERSEAMAARQSAHDREVELLERRINKLNTTLQETEQRLVHMASVDHLDPGISSIYRDVQGLSSSDRLYAKKKDLMSDIFRANLTIQKGAVAPGA